MQYWKAMVTRELGWRTVGIKYILDHFAGENRYYTNREGDWSLEETEYFTIDSFLPPKRDETHYLLWIIKADRAWNLYVDLFHTINKSYGGGISQEEALSKSGLLLLYFQDWLRCNKTIGVVDQWFIDLYIEFVIQKPVILPPL